MTQYNTLIVKQYNLELKKLKSRKKMVSEFNNLIKCDWLF